MRLAALVLVALLAAPAAASHFPLYFQREYGWFGVYTPGYYKPSDTFAVPASGHLLCYERLVGIGSYDAFSWRVTLRDGANRIVVLDAGALAEDPDEGVRVLSPLAPQSPTSFGYVAGTFTIQLEGDGYSGDDWGPDVVLRVYGVTARAECGRFNT